MGGGSEGRRGDDSKEGWRDGGMKAGLNTDLEMKLICSSGEDSTFPAPRSRLPLCFISALSGIHVPTVRQPPAAPSLGPDSVAAQKRVGRVLSSTPKLWRSACEL